jgi:hypothetical protein
LFWSFIFFFFSFVRHLSAIEKKTGFPLFSPPSVSCPSLRGCFIADVDAMVTRLAPAKRPKDDDNGGGDDDDGFFAPPARWQSQTTGPSTSSFPVVVAAASNAPINAAGAAEPSYPTGQIIVATAEDAERAWRHARRAGSGGGGSLTSPSASTSSSSSSEGPLQAPVDLYDALVHSVRETQYTLQPPGVSWKRKEREEKRERERNRKREKTKH